MEDLKNLQLLIQSNVPLLVIESTEEKRVVQLFKDLVEQSGWPLFKWTITKGIQRMERGFKPQAFNSEPRDALMHIAKVDQPGIYLMVDFHPYLTDPVHIRTIKEVAQNPKGGRHLVFVSPKIELPDELQSYSAKFQLGLPDHHKLLNLITAVAKSYAAQRWGRKVVASREDVMALARNLKGLNYSEAERLAKKVIFDDGKITKKDLQNVMKAKYEIFNQGGILALEHETAGFADLGGLDNLKRWLKLRKTAFLQRHNSRKLDPPKGVMLLGVQGCGKSLAAKVCAGIWGVPLLRLDFGGLYNKYIGETERNLRQSLETAQIMAPCVLWIDEIEKGISGGDGDDGVSRRVLGTMLTWMAERKEMVFLVATANDVSALPPEMLRKGRFDEIFFVDLPTAEVRELIFKIQLKERDLDPKKFDLPKLAELSQGFSGAEIEQAVVAALYASLGQDKDPNQAILAEEIRATRPLSVVMSEKVEGLRQWASSRTVPA